MKEDFFNIFTEFVAGGSLKERINEGVFDENKIKHYTKQILHGLVYIHSQGVVQK